MWNENYQWHFDYVRLAWDTGFSFEQCKSRNLDKNKICIVDVDRIIKDRDVGSVNRHIPLIVQYILEDEQSKVLDINFVKIFRISQLAVEFLLFCKRYLDNTVVLLKKELMECREELKNLKVFNNELESHVTLLMKNQTVTTFKCAECSKMFSTEDFLNSHMKRRHSSVNDNNKIDENHNETEKLHSEIKQLKERLNNAEKLLKEKEIEERQDFDNDDKMIEITNKFDKFKEKVDNELKELRMHKQIYEESYEKMVYAISANKEKKNVEDIATQTSTSIIEKSDDENFDSKQLKNNVETISNKIEINKKEIVENEKQEDEQINEKFKFEEKVSATLLGIENQMEIFKNKLIEIEKSKNMVENTDASTPQMPPVKPRSKFPESMSNEDEKHPNASIKEVDADGQLETRQEKYNSNSTPSNSVESVQSSKELHKSNNNNNTNESNAIKKRTLIKKTSSPLEFEAVSSSNSESEISESQKSSSSDKPIRRHIKSSSEPSLTNKVDHHRFERITSKNMKQVISEKMLNFNITEKCIGLSQKLYSNTLKIIKQKEKAAQKIYPDYQNFKKRILDEVNKQCEIRQRIKDESKIKEDKQRKQNVIKINYVTQPSKSNNNTKESVFSNRFRNRHSVNIRNRSLYESDSSLSSSSSLSLENNIEPIKAASMTKKTSSPQNWLYSNVINELTNKITKTNSNEINKKTITEANANNENVNLHNDKKQIILTGPPKKKKVLFDLNQSDNASCDEIIMEDNAVVLQRIDGGSTTSIESFILEDNIEQKVVGEERNEDIIVVASVGENLQVRRNDFFKGTIRDPPRAAPRRKIPEKNSDED